MLLIDFNVRVEGADAMVRALRRLPKAARDEFRREATKLSRELATKLRAAVRAESKGRMGSKVAPTIRAQTGLSAGVLVGPQDMVFGTEFGMNRKSGWYADERFRDNTALQYFRHQGDGYWWNPTIRASKPDADAAVERALDEAVRHWG